jgi:hypothetical protein
VSARITNAKALVLSRQASLAEAEAKLFELQADEADSDLARDALRRSARSKRRMAEVYREQSTELAASTS